MYKGLGQFDPNAALVPGQSYTMNFTVSEGVAASVVPDSLILANVENILLGWSPFSSGALTILAANISGGVLTLTVGAGAGATVLTEGGVESSIASTLNGSSVMSGFGGVTFTPADTGGLGVTTALQQFVQEGGITLSPLAPTTPGGGNWLLNALGIGTSAAKTTPTPSAPFPWGWLALAAGAATLIYAAVN